jgi:hypothetical protein
VRRVSLIVAVLVALGACSSGGTKASSAPATASNGGEAKQRRSSAVLTSAELRAANVTNVYDAVQRLRPSWLRSRGETSFGNASKATSTTFPSVFLDNAQYGSLGSLRQLTVDQVLEVQFISSSDATTRWGTGYTAGVILVVTRR